MIIVIFFIGLMIGIFLNLAIDNICSNITENNEKSIDIVPAIIFSILLEILFLRFGLNIIFVKAAAMTGILIIISFVDLRHRIIPNFMVIITLVIGILFSFFSGSSFIDIILGMLAGGGILFLLALIPNAMGGGDIKLMFAIGAFLGLYRTLWAIALAFILSSVISIGLILLKIKGTKDYIPFGPFLSLGSFISLLIETYFT
jgi:leader peptidase (prepilin peptidase)/N-methyltransferase